MAPTLTLTRDTSVGFKVRKLRAACHLTRRQLADFAGVSPEQVEHFERNLPVTLDVRRRILKELWARKIKK